MRQLPLNLIRGFLMGAADIVPGVSGGTIALVVGIYERLVASVRAGSKALVAAVRGRGDEFRSWWREIEWHLLIPLLIGILVAIALLAGVIKHQLETNPVPMAGLFVGLVAGSAVIAWALMRGHTRRDIVVLGVTAVLIFIVLGLRGGTSEETVNQLADPTTLAFFGAGAVAICAMILPGISGSFILVTLGMYEPVLGAVTDRDITTLLVFAAGATIGLAVFSQFLHWALAHHHDTVIAILIGLMIGSMRVLWPWPNGVASTSLGNPDGDVIVSLVLALVGLGAVLGLHSVALRLDDEAAERIPEADPDDQNRAATSP